MTIIVTSLHCDRVHLRVLVYIAALLLRFFIVKKVLTNSESGALCLMHSTVSLVVLRIFSDIFVGIDIALSTQDAVSSLNCLVYEVMNVNDSITNHRSVTLIDIHDVESWRQRV